MLLKFIIGYKIFQPSEYFQGNSVFQVKRKLFKILNDKDQ